MKYYCYNEQGPYGQNVVVTMSEVEIIASYYSHWQAQMRQAGKSEDVISPEDCLDDWRVVNWAWEVKD